MSDDIEGEPLGDGEERDLGSEVLFAESLDAISASADDADDTAYLGDPAVVDSLLRLFAKGSMDAGPDHAAVERRAKATAAIFLGRSKKNYVSVHRWNQPGSIDEFVAKWCGVQAATPEERIAGALYRMLGELWDVEEYARKPGITTHLWNWQVQAIIQRYMNIFMGIDLPTQAVASTVNLGEGEMTQE